MICVKDAKASLWECITRVLDCASDDAKQAAFHNKKGKKRKLDDYKWDGALQSLIDLGADSILLKCEPSADSIPVEAVLAMERRARAKLETVVTNPASQRLPISWYQQCESGLLWKFTVQEEGDNKHVALYVIRRVQKTLFDIPTHTMETLKDTKFTVGKFSELTPTQMAELKDGPGFDAFRAVAREKQARKAERRAAKESKREEARRRDAAAKGLTQNKLSKKERKALEALEA
ncbi:hypothetical protein PPROV_000497400 [Pycnococcus provasolii]|uniref:Uncharacterized protein n=1 Tax=Pycnococcus provasolii TaxID=41880 RepID=A0A830HMH7_9CHLO|nr:hypothetical protein PPROV_000497400 [Pycnococcus provasolii]